MAKEAKEEKEVPVPQTPEERGYYTVVELANLLGTNRRTLYRWIREGVMTGDTSSKAEFKIPLEEGARIIGMWDPEKKRLQKPKAEGETEEAPAQE